MFEFSIRGLGILYFVFSSLWRTCRRHSATYGLRYKNRASSMQQSCLMSWFSFVPCSDQIFRTLYMKLSRFVVRVGRIDHRRTLRSKTQDFFNLQGLKQNAKCRYSGIRISDGLSRSYVLPQADNRQPTTTTYELQATGTRATKPRRNKKQRTTNNEPII
jgi:hypothetical protein